MQSFYQHYYKKYIQALQNAADKADRWLSTAFSSLCAHMLLTCLITSCLTRLILLVWMLRAQLTKAYQTAAVLFEVLKAVNVSQKIELDQSVSATSVLLLWWIIAFSAFFFLLSYRNCFVSSTTTIKKIHCHCYLEKWLCSFSCCNCCRFWKLINKSRKRRSCISLSISSRSIPTVRIRLLCSFLRFPSWSSYHTSGMLRWLQYDLRHVWFLYVDTSRFSRSS